MEAVEEMMIPSYRFDFERERKEGKNDSARRAVVEISEEDDGEGRYCGTELEEVVSFKEGREDFGFSDEVESFLAIATERQINIRM